MCLGTGKKDTESPHVAAAPARGLNASPQCMKQERTKLIDVGSVVLCMIVAE